jgi:CheY-like chemotaxis protein
MQLVNGTFNLTESLDNLYSIFSMLCQDKELSFEYNAAESLPELMFGDETRLRQMLTNLLSNAVKYTKKGGVIFSAWKTEENILRFDVKDSGIGIRKEDMAKLFKPLEQLDLVENKAVGGTGLGLSISLSLCKLMGGDLKVYSVYDEGSTFSVHLPYMPPDEALAAGKDDGIIFDFKAPNAKILVVDDIDINLEVAEAMLGAFEIVPDLALSGLQAIELVKEKKYDMIFVDHIMPELDGIGTTKTIRALGGWNEKVPIIALTANAVDGMEQLFLSNQMNDCLFKPLNISRINLCLKKWLPSELINS